MSSFTLKSNARQHHEGKPTLSYEIYTFVCDLVIQNKRYFYKVPLGVGHVDVFPQLGLGPPCCL